MVCMNTSPLKIGRPPVAGALGQSGAGKLIWGLNGPREGVACALSRDSSPGQGESNPVQVKHFHRGGAETRRKCGMEEDATERVEVSRDGARGVSRLGGLA